MLARAMKRLPVVDTDGRLVGILSRLDVFKTVMREAPDWDAFRAQEIEVRNLRTVADIARRDAHTVQAEATAGPFARPNRSPRATGSPRSPSPTPAPRCRRRIGSATRSASR